MSMNPLIIGTRQSQLAIWQADYVAAELRALHPSLEVSLRFFVTQGDRVQDKPLPEIGGKGVFTAELERALATGEIDLAVHSLKDLPTDLTPEFAIGVVPKRASVYDALISRAGFTLQRLPLGATVGTSSLRRSAQLKTVRPDLNIDSLRGNVPTRVRKALQKSLSDDVFYDAIILAEAGLQRLDMVHAITEILSPDVMLPAPAQGALGIQCRASDSAVLALLAGLDDPPTRFAVTAERAFLSALDAGCRLPVAAWARYEGDSLKLTGRVISLDGSQVITVEGATPGQAIQDATQLGQHLASNALTSGADALLNAIRSEISPS